MNNATEQLNHIDIEREKCRERHQELYSRLCTLQEQLLNEEESVASSKMLIERLSSRRDAAASTLAEEVRKRGSVVVSLQEAAAYSKAQVIITYIYQLYI